MAVVTGVATTHSVAAQNVSLNYESLSSLEEPLAKDIGGITFVLTGLMDMRLSTHVENEDASDTDLVGNFQVSALKQLSNRWRIELAYFGQYVTDPTSVIDVDDGYVDNAAFFVGGVWGTVLGGNVSGIVREQTRRLRGAGNASLDFDDVLGMLEDRSAGYVGRFGPWVMSTVVDEDANFDLGAMCQPGAGTRDYRLTVRVTEGVYTPAGGSSELNT